MEVINLPDQTTQRLIAAAKAGNSAALARLLEENYTRIYKFLLKFTLDSQLAEDLTQDCMVRVIDKISLYDPQKSSLSTWMSAIAKNLWLDECRAGKRRRRLLQDPAEPEEDPVEEILRENEVLLTLKGLKEKFRLPILLKYAYGYRYEEIAAMMKIPAGTVKSRIFKGMKLLKKELGEDDEQGN